MAANEYSKYTPQQNYSPESFKDLAYAPLMMRERHDRLLNEQDKLLAELDNIQVQEEMRPYFDQKREEIKNQVDMLSNKLNTSGAGDPNLMNEFRNAKRAYNSEVSLSGGIGRSAELKKNIDAMQDNYYKFGLTQGWTPEKIQANYKTYYDSYFGGINPDDVGAKDFVVPKFEPKFAPKYIQPTDIIRPVADLVGEFRKQWGDAKIETYVDEGTGELMYGVRTPSGELMKNDRNLQQLSKYVRDTLNNPASPEMESLRYANIGSGKSDDEMKKEFMQRADDLIGIMQKEYRRDTSTLTTPQSSGGGGYGGLGGGSGSTKEEKPITASLNSLDAGKETFENANFGKIMSGESIRELEALETQPGGLTEDQSAKKNLLIQQQYTLDNATKDPRVLSKINESLKKNPLLVDSKKNPSNLDGYKNTIKSYTQQLNEFKTANAADAKLSEDYRSGKIYKGVSFLDLPQDVRNRVANGDKVPVMIQKKQAEIDKITNRVNEVVKEAIPQDMLKFSKIYTLNMGKDSDDLSKIINNGAQRMADDGTIFTIMENQGAKFSIPGEDGFSDTNNKDAMDQFRTARASGSMKLKAGSLIDSGSTGDSQLNFRYEYTDANGKQKSGDIFIDYNNKAKDTSVLDNYLTYLQENMNPTGKAVIQSFKDNKQFKGLDVDSRTRSTYINPDAEGFSFTQDKKIKQYNNDVTKELRLSSESGERGYEKVNYIKPEGMYNMYLSKDGFYEMEYKNTPTAKERYAVSAKQWMDREFYRLTKNPNSRGSFSQADINKVSSAEEQAQYNTEVYSMVRDLMDPTQQLIQIGGGPKKADGSANPDYIKFQNLRTQYMTDMQANDNNTAVQFETTKQFLKEIGGMRISHRNKKRFL